MGASGGIALREQRGREYYVAIGKRGGRPRLKTLARTRQAGSDQPPPDKSLLKTNDLRKLLAALKDGNGK